MGIVLTDSGIEAELFLKKRYLAPLDVSKYRCTEPFAQRREFLVDSVPFSLHIIA